MKDYILQRKIARIIAIIAERQGISQPQALIEFYKSPVCKMLHEPMTEMQLMSDEYIADEFFIANNKGKLGDV